MASTFDRINHTSEDAPARRSYRRVTAEDVFYMRKIEELANEKLTFFREKQEKQLRGECSHRDPKQVVVSSSRHVVCRFDDNYPGNNYSSRNLLGEQTKEAKKSKSTSKRQRSTPSGQKKRKVPKKSVRTPVISNEVTDRLKESIANEMKGTDLKLVIQKTLYYSDTIRSQNRLSMPINQLVTDEFLTADEKRTLSKKVEIEVMVFGPTLKCEMPMKLTMWHMASTVNYVLKTRWHEFWVENEEHLPENSKIQVWSFRRDEQLCFAVACVEKPDDEDEY